MWLCDFLRNVWFEVGFYINKLRIYDEKDCLFDQKVALKFNVEFGLLNKVCLCSCILSISVKCLQCNDHVSQKSWSIWNFYRNARNKATLTQTESTISLRTAAPPCVRKCKYSDNMSYWSIEIKSHFISRISVKNAHFIPSIFRELLHFQNFWITQYRSNVSTTKIYNLRKIVFLVIAENANTFRKQFFHFNQNFIYFISFI